MDIVVPTHGVLVCHRQVPTMATAVALLAENSMDTFDPVSSLKATARDNSYLLRLAEGPSWSLAWPKTLNVKGGAVSEIVKTPKSMGGSR